MEENRKIYMITGANSGIGKATALQLAGTGGTVVMICRDKERGEAAREEIARLTGNERLELMLADLSSFEEISQLADAYKKKFDHLDVLVNNAGSLFYDYKENREGLEMTFALNHMGYFRLTRRLMDLFEAQGKGRIVNVASLAHRMVKKGTRKFQLSENEYRGFEAYSLSKLGNILFTQELARRLQETEITANCLHPGYINSNFGKSRQGTPGGIFFSLATALLAKSPGKGAETSYYLATSSDVTGVSGRYFASKKERKPSALARDGELARQLWEESEKLEIPS